MIRSVRVVFDGEVLRPDRPVDLEPNTAYLVTIERRVSPRRGRRLSPYPLTEISLLATDMGVTDLAARHDRYAHGHDAAEDSSA